MKKIVLFLILFLLTGCTAKYNLIYNNDIFSESLSIIKETDNEMDGTNYIDDSFDYYLNNIDISTNQVDSGDYELSDGKYYNKSIINNGFKLGYEYNNYNDYHNSNIVHALFSNFYISDNHILTSGINNIFNNYKSLNNIEISFVTDKNIKSCNADKIIDGVYYWYINKDNYKDKSIDIRFDTKDDAVKLKEMSLIRYILIIILAIVLIFILIIYEKIKKSDK